MIPSEAAFEDEFMRRRKKERREWRDEQRRKYGKLGAASACRRIDPKTGEVLGVVEREPKPEWTARAK